MDKGKIKKEKSVSKLHVDHVLMDVWTRYMHCVHVCPVYHYRHTSTVFFRLSMFVAKYIHIFTKDIVFVDNTS